MKTHALTGRGIVPFPFPALGLVAVVLLVGPWDRGCLAQENSEQARISSSIAGDGTGSIVVEARGQIPEPPLFYTVRVAAVAEVSNEHVEYSADVEAKVIQGKARVISLGLNGPGQVIDVQADGLRWWSVRQIEDERFIDLHLADGTTVTRATVQIRSPELEIPGKVELAHLASGDAVGFASVVDLKFASGVEGRVVSAEGFAALAESKADTRLQSSTGGRIELSVHRSGTSPAPVEWVGTELTGEAEPDGESIAFRFSSTARVTEEDSEITVLSGSAAVAEMPASDDYRLRLDTEGDHPVYKLVFPSAGTFPVEFRFVAKTVVAESNRQHLDFTVAAGAVVPLTLIGLDDDLEFHRDQDSVVPIREDDFWLGFLPATGRAKLQWKTSRQSGEGKLFFTTTGRMEVKVGTGLLRQHHQIDYQVLQGELGSLSISMRGPGEVLDVQGGNVVAWEVRDAGEERRLDITLAQPITGAGQVNVRSQTPLGAFPVRSECLRLNPIGAIRHSGFLRMTNLGSVRVEPVALSGLTQLAPEQFPGDPVDARQVFVYRFPAADHVFSVAADRIQPEINISQLVLYQLAEADRVIRADIELDIRDAPIREWGLRHPRGLLRRLGLWRERGRLRLGHRSD